MNKELGAYYTDTTTIDRLIRPLFLDDLYSEFEEQKDDEGLKEFHKKISSLGFLDPAAGSGNILKYIYECLVELEKEILKKIPGEPELVSKKQFYGFEINTGECQFDCNIYYCDALLADWDELIPKEKINYIVGNPPYIGYHLQTKEQKAAMKKVYVDENGKTYKKAGKLDYCAGWLYKASQYMVDTDIRTAYIMTSSVCQGEQMPNIWQPLYDLFDIHIDYCWRPFAWDGEDKAKVVVIIVGLSCAENNKDKIIYGFEGKPPVITQTKAENINPYLFDGPNILVHGRREVLCEDIPKAVSGYQPTDGGYLLLNEWERNNISSLCEMADLGINTADIHSIKDITREIVLQYWTRKYEDAIKCGYYGPACDVILEAIKKLKI